MTEGFSFHQAKPGIEVSVKPRMAQLFEDCSEEDEGVAGGFGGEFAGVDACREVLFESFELLASEFGHGDLSELGEDAQAPVAFVVMPGPG
jgi:hypothetical protein